MNDCALSFQKWNYSKTPRIPVERIPEDWSDHDVLVKFSLMPETNTLSALCGGQKYDVNANNDVNLALMESNTQNGETKN